MLYKNKNRLTFEKPLPLPRFKCNEGFLLGAQMLPENHVYAPLSNMWEAKQLCQIQSRAKSLKFRAWSNTGWADPRASHQYFKDISEFSFAMHKGPQKNNRKRGSDAGLFHPPVSIHPTLCKVAKQRGQTCKRSKLLWQCRGEKTNQSQLCRNNKMQEVCPMKQGYDQSI